MRVTKMKNLTWIVLLSFLGIGSAQASLEQASTDVQTLIFTQTINNEFMLTEKDLCRCAQVSKAWERISSSDRIWKIRAEAYYRLPLQLSAYSPLLKVRNIETIKAPNISGIKKACLRIKSLFKPSTDQQLEHTTFFSYKSLVQHRLAINQRFAQAAKISIEDNWNKLTLSDMKKMVAAEFFGDNSLVKFYLHAWKTHCIRTENFNSLHNEVDVLIDLGSKVSEAEKLKWQNMEIYGYNNSIQE